MNRKLRRAAVKQGKPVTPVAPVAVTSLYTEALLHHQAGRLHDAQQRYRQVLAIEPRHADSLHLLGVVAYQAERADLAVSLIGQALTINESHAGYHASLGLALRSIGKPEEASASYRRSLELKPDSAETHNNFGNALSDAGRRDEALAHYRRALALQPHYPEAHASLANLLLAQGALEEAAREYRLALDLKPDAPEVRGNLAKTLAALRLPDESVAEYRGALVLKPDFPEAHYEMANILRDGNRLNEAAAEYRHALALKPDYAEADNNLANVLKGQARLDDAVPHYRHAIAVRPDYPEAHNNLANVLKDQGRLEEALLLYRQAFALKPDFIEARSNYLMSLHYSADHGEADLLAEARQFAQQIERPRIAHEFANERDPQRVLRVGYLSPDFRDHPVGYFLARVLEAHDGAHVDVTGYSNSRVADGMTARLKAAAGQWRTIAGMSDSESLELIRRDKIDILVDLSGHTAMNRLSLFALKPAPVQVSWLGYFGTTGLGAMDYILADRFVVPSGHEQYYVEKIWRMPDSYLCFAPPDLDIPVRARPVAGAPLVLGCFNNFAKVTPHTISLWAEVLAAVPDARLFLKTKSLGDAAGRQQALDRFASNGVTAERLVLEGPSPRAELLDAYNRVDIALDPVPYGGGTTTAEALWMGVPVVTMHGESFVGRVSESIVATVGFPELVAPDRAGYVATVAGLANDRARRSDLHGRLRPMVEIRRCATGRVLSVRSKRPIAACGTSGAQRRAQRRHHERYERERGERRFSP